MPDEKNRLQSAARINEPDLQHDPEFEELVQMASEICDAQVAFIMLYDGEKQWAGVCKGAKVDHFPQLYQLCLHIAKSQHLVMIEDITDIESSITDLANFNETSLRFFAGVPLVTSDKQTIGTLCVTDKRVNILNHHQQLMFKMLAKQAVNLLEHRANIKLLEKNKQAFETQSQQMKNAGITLRSFFESAPNFHVLLGMSGEVLDFNKVAFNFIKKVHGAELERGNMLVKYIAPDFVNKFLGGFNTALTGEKAFEEGSTDYGAHGIIYWEASFETARDMNGEIIGISYIIRDVSDRKIREHKILAQNQSLLKIAHLQAHEFRAPLTTITGMLDLIRAEDYQAPADYFELLENAVKNLDSKIREVVDNVDDIVLEGTEVYKAR